MFDYKDFIIRRGQMYFADLGQEKNGSVQGNERPVIILGNDLGNKYSPVVIVSPISSRLGKKFIKKMPTHVDLIEPDLEKDSYVMTEQILTIPKEKLKFFIGRVQREKLREIDEAINISLGLKDQREEEIYKQVAEVKKAEEFVTTLKGLVNSGVLNQFKVKYQIELNKLESICIKHRRNINDYYIATIIRDINIVDSKRAATV